MEHRSLLKRSKLSRIEYWPKHKSGIRPGYLNELPTRSAKTKFDALHICVIAYGNMKGDLWRQKKPGKFVAKIDREVKLNTSVLEKNPELFPGLRHTAGCSLQYLIMLAECLGGADWYETFINRFDEADVEPVISQEKLESLLEKVVKPIHLGMERI